MPQFEIPNPDQLVMLQYVYLRSIVSENPTVNLINSVVDRLDTLLFEAAYDTEAARGNEPIHPKTIIKVCLYALHRGRFTTRKMEQDTTYDVGYMFLTGCRTIDHTTFSKFLSRFRREVVDLFSQIVGVCQKEKLMDFKVLATDSVKLRANASYKQQKNVSGLDKTCQRVRAKIEQLIANADRQDDSGCEGNITDAEREKQLWRLEKRDRKLNKAMGILQERLAKATDGKSETEAAELKEKLTVNVTDTDAQIMQQRNGEHNPAFSITTTTDTKSDIITGFQVHLSDNDGQALKPAIEDSHKNTGQYHEYYSADSAHNTIENLEYLEENGLNGLLPDKRTEVVRLGITAKGEYDRSNFRFDSAAKSYICPQQQVLSYTGKLTVNGRSASRYANPQACSQCPMRAQCTKAQCRVLIRDDNEAVRERMRSKLAEEENKTIYKLRAHSAESPYGCIKRNWRFICLLRRGVDKVTMECALLFSLHNILKMDRPRAWCYAT